MGHTSTITDRGPTCQTDTSTARPLAPEDVHKGDFVALLHEIFECPSFLWCAESYQLPWDEPVRLTLIPEPGMPLKVQSVCVPFVLVKDAAGGHKMLDLRKCRLARLDRGFARAAWKIYKKQRDRPAAASLV